MGGLDFEALRWLVALSLAVAALLVRRWWRSPDWAGADSPCTFGTSATLLALCAKGAFVTLAGHRPDADDAFYAGMALAPLEHPGVALREIEGSYWLTHYGMATYEPLRALAADVTGEPPLRVYYLWAPALFGALLVLANFELLRLWNGRLALLGVVAACAVFLLWGDTHRTHSNFGLLRLFQGKAVLVAVLVPLLTAWAWRSVRDGAEPRGRMLLGVVAAIGMSPTGLVLPLMLLALIYGACAVASARSVLRAAVYDLARRMAGIAWYPPVIALFVLWSKPGVAVRASGDGLDVVSDSLGDNLALVFGLEPRGLIILGAALLLPLCVAPGLRRPLMVWTAVAAVSLFNPWSSEALRTLVSDSMAWRLWWVLPLPAIAGLGAAALAGKLPELLRVPAAAAPALLLGFVMAGFAVLTGQWVLSTENKASLRWPPELKLEDPTRMPHRYYRDSLVILGTRVCSPRSGSCQ